MRKLGVVFILIILLAGWAVPTAARQDQVATVWVTEGTASITLADGGDPQEVATDDVALVSIGDQVAVSEDGEALLTFFEGAESRLAATTVIEVGAFEQTDTSSEASFEVLVGQTITSVEAMMDTESRFEINTPAATITVRGTEFIVFVRPNQLTQVATLEGTVDVEAEEQSVEVPSGYGVKMSPGEPPGAVSVWGQLTTALTAPVEEMPNLPVTLTNVENGQVYHYRAQDLMMAALGAYELVVNSPGPVRVTDIVFGPDTEAETPLDIDVALGALAFEVIGDAGAVLDDTGDLIVRFEQGDLAGETVTAPGDPVLVGPGDWQIQVVLASAPDQTQTLNLSVKAGEALIVRLSRSQFRAGG
jgi:hypothetical protein